MIILRYKHGQWMISEILPWTVSLPDGELSWLTDSHEPEVIQLDLDAGEAAAAPNKAPVIFVLQKMRELIFYFLARVQTN